MKRINWAKCLYTAFFISAMFVAAAVASPPLSNITFYVDTLANLPARVPQGQALAIVTDHSYGLYYFDGTTWNASGSGGGGSGALSALTASTGSNSIDNGTNAQTWNWNSATTGNAFSFGSNSITSGSLLTSSITTAANTGYAGYFSDTATSASQNILSGYALYANGQIAASYPSPGLFGTTLTSAHTYNSFGDSITSACCNTSSPTTNGYAFLIANDLSANWHNYGSNGWMACNTATTEVFTNTNPTTGATTINTMMIGTNDAGIEGAGPYEVNYHLCHQASLSWLAIPSVNKTFLSNCTLTGTWVADNSLQTGIAEKSTTNGSTATCSITTYGGPIYLWYLVEDSNGGVFTYAVDSGSTTSLNSTTVTPIFTSGGTTTGIALQRITGVAAGTHAMHFNITSATSASNLVSLYGVGTPPPIPYTDTNVVFSAGVLRQQNDASSADTAAYDADAQFDANLLAADGLAIRFVPIRPFVNTTTDMTNTEHPNNAGHEHLKNAFEKVMQPVIIPNTTIAGGNYHIANAMGLTSTSNLDGGFLVYSNGGASPYGIDLGYESLYGAGIGGNFSTRVFAPALVTLGTYGGSAPTGQTGITPSLLAYAPANTIGGYGSVQVLLPSNTTETGLGLRNTTTTGHEWDLYSMTSGDACGTDGDFAIADATDRAARLCINGTTGNVGIGLGTAPTAKLEVNGSAQVDGALFFTTTSAATASATEIHSATANALTLTASGFDALTAEFPSQAAGFGFVQVLLTSGKQETGLGLKTTISGGHEWDLYSTGTGDAFGAGPSFVIADTSIPAARFGINAAGNVGIGTASALDKLDVAGGIGVTTTSSAPTLGIYSAAGGTLSVAGLLALPNITTDATHTDATLCEDTTSHTVYFGSGTLGICLGTSSARYKTDIIPMEDGLAQIEALKPVNYYYIAGHGDNGARQQYGFLAEDVAKVLPKLTAYDKDNKPNSVDILGMVPVTVAAIQELQNEIRGLAILFGLALVVITLSHKNRRK